MLSFWVCSVKRSLTRSMAWIFQTKSDTLVREAMYQLTFKHFWGVNNDWLIGRLHCWSDAVQQAGHQKCVDSNDCNHHTRQKRSSDDWLTDFLIVWCDKSINQSSATRRNNHIIALVDTTKQQSQYDGIEFDLLLASRFRHLILSIKNSNGQLYNQYRFESISCANNHRITYKLSETLCQLLILLFTASLLDRIHVSHSTYTILTCNRFTSYKRLCDTWWKSSRRTTWHCDECWILIVVLLDQFFHCSFIRSNLLVCDVINNEFVRYWCN